MSGVLQLILAGKLRPSPLSAGSVTLTSGTIDYVGTPLADQRYYGYSLAGLGGFGAVSPTSLSGYTIEHAYEVLTLSSTDGGFAGNAVTRKILLQLTSGPTGLIAGDIASITFPGSQVLTGTSAAFTNLGTGGSWLWTVTTGTNDGSADYMGSGTLEIAV